MNTYRDLFLGIRVSREQFKAKTNKRSGLAKCPKSIISIEIRSHNSQAKMFLFEITFHLSI